MQPLLVTLLEAQQFCLEDLQMTNTVMINTIVVVHTRSPRMHGLYNITVPAQPQA